MHRYRSCRSTRQDAPAERERNLSRFASAVESRSAADATRRGGDVFCTLDRADGSTAVLLADISSKGALSVLHAEIMRRAFMQAATFERTPARILAELNELRFEIPGRSASVTFASAVVAVLDPHARFVRYASAGHDIGVIAHGRAHRHLAPTGPVLGVIDGAVYADCMEPFAGDDLLVLATDGFTECRNAGERSEQFGTSGLVRALAASGGGSCRAAADAVARGADLFTGGLYRDDATVAVVAHNAAR
jgi:serine phosphatase RsbU (regulator of sigma subunit)